MTPQCPSEDDRNAPCGLLTISIYLEAMNKNYNNSLTGWGKQLLTSAWKSAPTKSKILVNNWPKPSTNILMGGKVLEEVDRFEYLRSTQTKDGTSLKEAKIILPQAHSAMTRLAVL